MIQNLKEPITVAANAHFLFLDSGNISPKIQVKQLGETISIRYQYPSVKDYVPSVQWFIKGRPLTHATHFRKQKFEVENTKISTFLIIRDINWDDAGPYQCRLKYMRKIPELRYSELMFETTAISILKIDGTILTLCIHSCCTYFSINK